MQVYKLTSPSNKSYIGFTSRDYKLRFKEHCGAAERYDSSQPKSKLLPALQKYNDYSKWDVDLLYECEDEQEALDMEIFLIQEYNTINEGYNILKGGQKGFSGLTLSEEHKEKLSEAKTKYWNSSKGLEHKRRLSTEFKENKSR